MTGDEFSAAWLHFVRRWDEARQRDEAESEGLVEDILVAGLAVLEPGDGDQAITLDVLAACERAVIAASGQFDEDGYRQAQQDLQRMHRGEIDALDQFCEEGWLWLRNPNADFDVDWYWHEYLDPDSEDVNPLLHYLVAGRQAGNGTRRPQMPVRLEPPAADGSTKRVCLFAAYDIDGIVDQYVLDYLSELSKYADVYYLCDGYLAPEELAKLAGVTAGAWAIGHGRYDFGSYSLLANELVGWDTIDTYDELLFANDSCFLLKSLGSVFERMDDVRADWWGLQPTKRPFRRENGDTEPISLDEALRHQASVEDWSMYDRLHVSSYFLLFRKRVMQDKGFRERLNLVRAQPHKSIIIVRYEIAISNYLIGEGYKPATYIDALYPYHPLYSADFFNLVEQGFPLLKRNFIGENPQSAPDLRDWKSRISAVAPEADLDTIERNLLRVAAQDKLQRSFSIFTREDGTIEDPRPMGPNVFRRADRRAPKYEHWWAFPVCAYDHTFAGNERAVFEEVKDDPSIKKIILTRSRKVEAEGENVVIAPIESLEGQHLLLRSGQIFVKHGPIVNLTTQVDPKTHNVINLWHGIPLKRFGLASAHFQSTAQETMLRNHAASRVVISSSHMDRLAMSAAFFPASYPDMWPTGLPRNDFIVRAEERLPADLRATIDRLREELAGRRLVMFLPTFRDGQGEAQYKFSESELAWLAAWAQRHGAVLGVREHMADKARTYSSALMPLGAIDLSSRRYPDLEILYRIADALISDYSSCLVDFMMTGKPVVSFAYDYDRYNSSERGLFYELDRVLPGPVCRSFDELATALDGVFDTRTDQQDEEYDWKRRIFFDHLDDQASWRVVKRVKGLYLDEE